MRLVRPPFWIKIFYPSVLWRGVKDKAFVYLTFDDGPVPEVTPWVMQVLDDAGIKATFFCVGENVLKNSELYKQLITKEHQVGNHSYNHIVATQCSWNEYVENLIKARIYIDSDLFRPPHGKLTPWQAWKLRKMFRKIVLWDVLSYDYDNSLNPFEIIENVMKNVRNGSIIVFHDSVKAFDRLKIALPELIAQLKAKGFEFKII